jgi:hypothetical protein
MKTVTWFLCLFFLAAVMDQALCDPAPGSSANQLRFELITTSDWTNLAFGGQHKIRSLTIIECSRGGYCDRTDRRVMLNQPIGKAEDGSIVRVTGTFEIPELLDRPLEFSIERGHIGYTTVRLYYDFQPAYVGAYTWSGINQDDPDANEARFLVDVAGSLVMYGSESPIDPEVLDQDNFYGTCCIYQLEHPHLYQQVVTSGTTGHLSTILLEIHESRGGSIVRFSLHEGSAIPDSAPILTEDVDVSRFAGEQYRWNVSKADFRVQPGTVFTIGIMSVDPDSSVQFGNDEENQYDGGDLFVDGEPLDPSMDLAFQTFVAKTPE